MADHIDEGPLNNPANTESENIIMPTEFTKTTNPNQDKDAHTQNFRHAPNQGWKHYFFEFFMLFLAVFAGFLAENQREHIDEQQREKKFARRLLSDLRQDSTFFEIRINHLEARQNAYSKFLKIMTKQVNATDSEVMRGFIPLIMPSGNDFTTATYNQMKTSGSLRYIANDYLTTSLQEYYDVLLSKASRDADGADKFFSDHIISYMTKHFRFQDFRPGNDASVPTKLLNRTTDSDQELINIMGVWASNCDTQLNYLRPAQTQMSELIKLIKNEYHLE